MSVNLDLVCPIKFKSHLAFMNHHNGAFQCKDKKQLQYSSGSFEYEAYLQSVYLYVLHFLSIYTRLESLASLMQERE